MKKGVKKKKGITRAAKNKKAFDDVIGDPFAYPEQLDGHYLMLKSRSSVMIADVSPKSKGPVNGARPNPIDFACDVESAVTDGLEVFYKRTKTYTFSDLKEIFDNTYLLGSGEIFNQKERAALEQDIGQILVDRGISPVAKYFTVIKQ
jgi:hypothetical protein